MKYFNYCKECNRYMNFYLESEIFYTPTVIRRFYKCPKCGTIIVKEIDLTKK